MYSRKPVNSKYSSFRHVKRLGWTTACPVDKRFCRYRLETHKYRRRHVAKTRIQFESWFEGLGEGRAERGWAWTPDALFAVGGVMVHSMCRLDWVTRCPDSWSHMVLGVSAGVWVKWAYAFVAWLSQTATLTGPPCRGCFPAFGLETWALLGLTPSDPDWHDAMVYPGCAARQLTLLLGVPVSNWVSQSLTLCPWVHLSIIPSSVSVSYWFLENPD